MAIKPILFNTEMVRAILDGRKSCTRRIVKPQQFIGMLPDKCKNGAPEEFLKEKKLMFKPYCDMTDIELINTAYKASYQPGDILYVRETWSEGYEEGTYIYRASDKLADLPTFKESSKLIYHPSIHMPKEAARIWLKITNVRVERLQDIDEDGVWNEGFRFTPPCLTRVSADGHTCDLDGPCTSHIKYCDMTMGELFGRELWDKTIKKSDLDRYGWDANPYVFVIEFVKIDKPEEIQNA
jgi:hypothetical protein|nr:MAG TPA: ASCH domain protein [Caudoviricetes sp.]